jgi:hypothetical protein
MDSLLEKVDRLLGNNEITPKQPTMETPNKEPNLPRAEKSTGPIESNIADQREFLAFLKETAKNEKKSNACNCDPPRENPTKTKDKNDAYRSDLEELAELVANKLKENLKIATSRLDFFWNVQPFLFAARVIL